MRKGRGPRLTGYAKSELAGMVCEETPEESALPGTGWPREDERTRPMRTGHERKGGEKGLTTNRTGSI